MKAIRAGRAQLLVIREAHAAGLSNNAIGRKLGRSGQWVAKQLKLLSLETNFPKGTDPITRFWTHVDRSNDCWVWTGGRNSDGYGNFKIHGATVRASRYSFMLSNPHLTLTPKDLVCHRCDNRPCVRPEHLFLGSAADNTADMISKGRACGPSGLRSGQRKGAATRRRRALEVTLPALVAEMKVRAEAGIPLRQRNCLDIPGFYAVVRRVPFRVLKGMAQCSD